MSADKSIAGVCVDLTELDEPRTETADRKRAGICIDLTEIDEPRKAPRTEAVAGPSHSRKDGGPTLDPVLVENCRIVAEKRKQEAGERANGLLEEESEDKLHSVQRLIADQESAGISTDTEGFCPSNHRERWLLNILTLLGIDPKVLLDPNGGDQDYSSASDVYNALRKFERTQGRISNDHKIEIRRIVEATVAQFWRELNAIEKSHGEAEEKRMTERREAKAEFDGAFADSVKKAQQEKERNRKRRERYALQKREQGGGDAKGKGPKK